MRYWLMKSEPAEFSIDDLRDRPNSTEPWDGVRNYQARNMLRDEMKQGDQAFFYHSNCEQPGIYGIMEVASAPYPDATAFDPDDKHYDPKSDPDKPRWMLVDMKFITKFDRPRLLTELRACKPLANMQILQRGNRLSITQVTRKQWDIILRMHDR
jgi:predicted RNA-binding protein with PUA-like domain